MPGQNEGVNSRSVWTDRRLFLKQVALAGTGGLAGCQGVEELQTPRAEDAWRMVGYDAAHTGYNPAATGPGTPVEVEWRVSDLPGLVWPPVVVGDTAYTASAFGDPGGDLRALSTDDGETRWEFVPSDPGVGIPAVVDGTVYIGNTGERDRHFTALDSATGDHRWTFETQGEPLFPKVADGTVYFWVRKGESLVYAIDAETGEERWRFEQASDYSPTLAVADGLVYLGTGSVDTTVYALDAATGSEQWRFAAATGDTNVPAVAHDTVYVGSTDTTVYALDATSGEERWRFEQADSAYDIPAADDDTVYIRNGDSNLYAIDAESGEERWRFEEPTEHMGSPSVVGNTLYAPTEGGTLYALT